ncbi:MAG: hypothetical protein QNJ41_12195 [Xenococcaceae cyanobacterium MO_188.B32]|nr:hypothetical protein [Xenococcaceae cyanobacterium MO_188.B32]
MRSVGDARGTSEPKPNCFLAESFGAKLHGLPWMEALNLCTVGTLAQLVPSFNS